MRDVFPPGFEFATTDKSGHTYHWIVNLNGVPVMKDGI